MSNDLANKVLSAISEKDPQALGNITVNEFDGTIFVGGQVFSSVFAESGLEATVREALGDSNVIISKLLKSGLTVSAASSLATTEDPTAELDEVEVLYQGLLPASSIIANDEFKKVNHETLVKVKRAIEVVGFIAPIVLDSTFKVIDGNLRLAALRKLHGADTSKKIPVIIINDADAKADFLRLVLNRSSEFQRWVYPEVDSFVDEWPQLQPVFEPLGFFANKILPNSFFGGTVVEYKIDEYNDQQQKYSQDIGLAEWAKMRREQILKEAQEKKELRDRKKKPTEGMVSLFDLVPTEDDFTPTHDIDAAVREHTLEQRDVAGTITDNYDEIRKKVKEDMGQSWQTSRRDSKTKAADKRAEAEAATLALVDGEVEVSEEGIELADE